MTRSEQKCIELDVFGRFAVAAELEIEGGSLFQPPESSSDPRPDIECELIGVGQLSFELCAVVDKDMMVKRARWMEECAALWVAWREGPEWLREGVAGRHVVPRFRPLRARRLLAKSARKILELVAACPRDTQGYLDVPASLAEQVASVKVECTGLGGPLMSIPMFTEYRDAAVNALESKFGKHYSGGRNVELILYYRGQDSRTFDARRDVFESAFIDGIKTSPFQRVWVYDDSAQVVLWVAPELSGTKEDAYTAQRLGVVEAQ